jgi:amino acid transporter
MNNMQYNDSSDELRLNDSSDELRLNKEKLNPIEIEVENNDLQLQQGGLKRSLNFIDSFGIIVGIIIGSGIFSSPGVALERAGSSGAVLIAWSLSGLLVCITAQCYFELGCLYPTAGGDYDYLLNSYGETAAFSFAWFNFFISKPGSQAIIATIFGRYISSIDMIRNNNYNQHLLNSQESDSTKFFAIVSIIILTLLNCIGLKESSLIQNILTFSKIILVISIFLIAMVYSFYHPTIFYENLSPSVAFKGTKLFSFGSSMVTLLLLILLQIIYNINYYHY